MDPGYDEDMATLDPRIMAHARLLNLRVKKVRDALQAAPDAPKLQQARSFYHGGFARMWASTMDFLKETDRGPVTAKVQASARRILDSCEQTISYLEQMIANGETRPPIRWTPSRTAPYSNLAGVDDDDDGALPHVPPELRD